MGFAPLRTRKKRPLDVYIRLGVCQNRLPEFFQSLFVMGMAKKGIYTNQSQRIRCLYMPTIRVKENEPFEVAMRRFKRTIEKSGLLTELRAREFYEKPTTERKRKKAAAIKRHYKRLRSMMLPKKLY